jgi:hypothetical protein
MSHLLAFHLGPVQDFIAIARRTQDWWMGSWLLSHLTRKAIEMSVTESSAVKLYASSRAWACISACHRRGEPASDGHGTSSRHGDHGHGSS